MATYLPVRIERDWRSMRNTKRAVPTGPHCSIPTAVYEEPSVATDRFLASTAALNTFNGSCWIPRVPVLPLSLDLSFSVFFARSLLLYPVAFSFSICLCLSRNLFNGFASSFYSASTENATWESPAPHVAREFAIRVLWPAISATWRAARSPTLTPGFVLHVSGGVKYD